MRFRSIGAVKFAEKTGLQPELLLEEHRIFHTIVVFASTMLARSILNGAVAEIPDTSADPHYAAGLLAGLATARSIAAVPMLKDGRQPIGSIEVARGLSRC